MKIYLRKILDHDITHEISITKEIVKSFFENNNNFLMIGKTTQIEYNVTINNVTDPRFGGEIKLLIRDEGNCQIDDILKIIKLSNNKYELSIIRPVYEEYDIINKLYNDYNEKRHITLELSKTVDDYFEKDNYDRNLSENRIKGASNLVYYGIPGCGKSYTVNEKYGLKKENKNNYIRLTFHPEYTYEDFVGQILPKLEDEKVKYIFEPGPFTKILKKSLINKNKMYYLVIEELNRGNAPAIFGDIFQLLDRNIDGNSEYLIDNKLISSYFDEIAKKDPEKYKKLKNIDKIYLPSNLSIICTMNTSDQNVFVMDTAFKRRFEFIKIKNNIEECKFKDLYLPIKIKCTWKEFVNIVNNKIVEDNFEITNAEDKQVGAYFINETYLNKENEEFNEEKSKKFAEKVLMYLWEDVFKYNRKEVFKNINSLDKLIEMFCGESINEVFDCLKTN